MSTVHINKSNANIDVPDQATYVITGDDNTIAVNVASTVTALGSGLHIAADLGSTLTVGGNGQFASNADDNFVEYFRPGALHVLKNSRVEVSFSAGPITLAGYDNLGAYGGDLHVAAAGIGNGVWMGQNGINGTQDTIAGLTNSSLYEFAGSNVRVNGSHYAASINGDDALTALGKGAHVTAIGSGNVLTIGGNGVYAANGDDDVVSFLGAGATVKVLQNSRVDVTASNSRVTLVGDDTLGLYGSGDSVSATGALNSIWIGQNGANAPGAAVDRAHMTNGGSVYEMQGSTVAVDGANYQVSMTGDDTLTTSGSGVKVYVVSGSLNTVMANSASVAAASTTSSTVVGDNDTVNAARGAQINVLGGGNSVVAAEGSRVSVGQISTTGSSAADTVQWSGDAGISVLGISTVSLLGDYGAISLGGGDQVAISGAANAVASLSGNNHITIGGNGASTFPTQVINHVSVTTGDSVTMLTNSSLALQTSGAVTNGQYAVQMAANDYLAVSGGATVYVPTAAGDDYLAGFGSTDVLQLAAHFSSIADFDAHTGFNHLNQTTIQLDTSGDYLTLDISKTQVHDFAVAGLIKFT